MERWASWLFIKRLVETLKDPGIQDPSFRHMRGMYRPIDQAIMLDGNPIKMDDPAVALFFKMIGVDSPASTDLADAVRKLETWYLINLKKPGIVGYESPALADLMALRLTPNGWVELDRVFRQIAEEPLSKKADRVTENLLIHPDDPGVNGPVIYSIDYLVMKEGDVFDNDKVYASTPGFAVSLIDELMRREGERYLKYGSYHDSGTSTLAGVYLRCNGEIQFLAPVVPGKTMRMAKDGLMKPEDDYSKPQVNWAEISWQKYDRSVMKEVAAVLPRALATKVKGTYLSDELGM